MSGKSPGPDTVTAFLRERVQSAGSVGFDEFMAAALYHPGAGYYDSATPRIGRAGDYFTSVSVGPVFGRLLAAQVAEMHGLPGSPGDFTLVEQGADSGRLMADILGALDRDHPQCRPRVLIVEPLAAPRARQEETLLPWRDRVEWIAHERDLPPFRGVFLANELVDAFPVKLLVRDNRRWLEQRVAMDGDRFVFTEEEISDPALLAETSLWPLPSDVSRFRTEFCPGLAPWLHTLAQRLDQGWLLLIDYGHPAAAHFHPARAGGTLAAYARHRRVDDPLAAPGAQDLTWHVDFTALARSAGEAGLDIAGFTDQHHALVALAERVFPPMPGGALPPEAAREMRALRQLLHPESMGTAFHFMALAKGTDTPLAAFRYARDPRDVLYRDPGTP